MCAVSPPSSHRRVGTGQAVLTPSAELRLYRWWQSILWQDPGGPGDSEALLRKNTESGPPGFETPWKKLVPILLCSSLHRFLLCADSKLPQISRLSQTRCINSNSNVSTARYSHTLQTCKSRHSRRLCSPKPCEIW